MSLFDVGRLCMKLAGRDAGRACVVVEKVDDRFVVVDGATRRRKVNVGHLEPLAETISLKNKASHNEVKKEFEKLGLAVWDKKSKTHEARVKRQKKKSTKPTVDKKAAKKVEKKEVKVEEAKPEIKAEVKQEV